MNPNAGRLSTLSPPVRVACSVAAAVCAAIINVGLLGLFNSTSTERWLQPTPLLLSAKAHCDALPGRSERTHCAQTLVARALAAGQRPEIVAAR